MKIMIIRHAEPDYSIDSLTEKGHREAALLADRLARVPDVTAIYQSPLGRARETARYSLEKMGCTAETLPWLQEFRGKAWDSYRKTERIVWDYRQEQWHDRPELFHEESWAGSDLFRGGDVEQIWDEVCRGTDEVLARHGYVRDGHIWRCEDNGRDTLMFFCHFGVGTAMMAYLTGLSPIPLWHAFSMQPSSVTTLVTQERTKGEVDFRCFQYGDLSHLYVAGEPHSTAALFAECYDGRDSTDPIEWGDRRKKG